MTREEVYKELNSVFQDVFDDESIELKDETTSADIEDWDSLENINLIVSIQARFRIKFDMEEIAAMKNVGEMVDRIISHL